MPEQLNGIRDALDVDPLTGFPLKPVSPKLNDVLRAIAGGIKDQIVTPGAVAKPNPYPEGSEEAAWYDNNRAATMANWAPGMALNTMGTGAIVGVPVKGSEVLMLLP